MEILGQRWRGQSYTACVCVCTVYLSLQGVFSIITAVYSYLYNYCGQYIHTCTYTLFILTIGNITTIIETVYCIVKYTCRHNHSNKECINYQMCIHSSICLQLCVVLSLQPRLVVGYLYRYPEHQSVVFEVLSILVRIVVEVNVGDETWITVSSPSLTIHHSLTALIVSWE